MSWTIVIIQKYLSADAVSDQSESSIRESRVISTHKSLIIHITQALQQWNILQDIELQEYVKSGVFK